MRRFRLPLGILAAFLFACFVLMFQLPQLLKTYEDTDQALSSYEIALFRASDILLQYWYVIIPAVTLSVVGWGFTRGPYRHDPVQSGEDDENPYRPGGHGEM